jgi:hypothetical protein
METAGNTVSETVPWTGKIPFPERHMPLAVASTRLCMMTLCADDVPLGNSICLFKALC